MATALALYNACLLELGDRKLASTSEDRESRRVIDIYYDNVLADCLEQGLWNFATRTVKVEADTSITPEFGYSEVFAKPSDWVRTAALSLSETLFPPLLDYYDDVNYWSAGSTPIYVRYVSNSASWGLSLTLWPRSFTRYVELELAVRGAERLTSDTDLKERLLRDRNKARINALNKDALNEPNTKFAPMGSWNRARSGGSNSGSNRGGWPSQV